MYSSMFILFLAIILCYINLIIASQGGVCITCHLDATKLAFICVHLAAHEVYLF